MSTAAAAELEEYPKYKANYLKAFDRMLKNNDERGIKHTWKNAQDVYNWWLKLDREPSEEEIDYTY